MGVKGLQYFMEKCCPETCVMVDFREMARQHVNSHQQGSSIPLPTLVVDGMACLRHWYSCQAWVYGGQWKEYMHCLKEFVGAFVTAGIRLVFFFDGVVEEEKRAEWVNRRLKVNEEVARVFHYLKYHGQQPGRELFCLPSGLATFSRFALKSLGQETWCSVREADYEIASFALRHNCMGILGQDTDFIIYDSVPYLSVAQLRLDTMTTVLFSTDKLCHALQLQKSELPLLACLLGNDVVPEQRMQRLRSDALAAYRRKYPQSPPQGEKIYAVADFISSNKLSREGAHGVSCLPLTDREVLEKGVQYYLLPGQQPLWDISDTSPRSPVCLMKSYLSPDILQAAKEKHMRAECFMVYNVLYDGVVECSNTLEDREDAELTPQAIVYQSCRERIYGILLPTYPDSSGQAPAVREWFVFPGNPLKDPKVVSPLPLNHSDLKRLWFGKDSETKCLRIATFLAIFELDEFSVEHDRLDGSLMAVLCLVTYIAMQVSHLSLEDIDAYLSQAICVRYKSYTELLHTRVSHVEPRAVQLGSLFVRGLTHLVAANSACGCPFPMEQLMPWNTFDGLLFHSKYLLAHSGRPQEELLEGNASWVSLFRFLRELVLGICSRRGRTIQSRPRITHPGKHVDHSEQWSERGAPSGHGPSPQRYRPQTRSPSGQHGPSPQHYRPQTRSPSGQHFPSPQHYRPQTRSPSGQHGPPPQHYRPQTRSPSGQHGPPPQHYIPQSRGPRAQTHEHNRPRSTHPNRRRYHLAPSFYCRWQNPHPDFP
ncbi:constitutive coactivator of peroxisome proliferator-activated receptor gamma isoform X1 [Oncorhynchus keta]|uniref:constitutive coactivator of peroxisome proliferator-activated receptor gamma isoform X1 n=1 Tax=Oncorhynchus keta TaxID=8018 RepID=UPI0015F93E8F|nr:constitutive coactivator of peroxisome proliferator-activated receptor gamma isoform X1 [Oncorhynchus keta]XP_052333964.1 constitutive coactivator of peroxisome proliferator-activated receptor gamma isoform X1 [Oncorhynchus keta]XP_052333965.1 constitutive coactivator of peroxisome proliferator-activated receptor gamma isoform X1 [Oncorhynchus keta]